MHRVLPHEETGEEISKIQKTAESIQHQSQQKKQENS